MRSTRFPSLVLLFLLLHVYPKTALGQSGRRTPPPTSTEKRAPDPDLVKGSSSSSDEIRTRIRLLIGRQPTSRHLLSEDTIYAAFIQRLNEQKYIEVAGFGDLRKREDAIKQARMETNRFVVLLQLAIDNYQQGTIVLNSPDLEIKYLVFAPRTGQQRFKGKVYFQAIGGARARKDAWPNGPPIKITPEAAAIAAADGLYDWLLLAAGIRER